MSLTRGARLGPYEVLVPLGAGGMGEVYRARDTRLDREVAVKVLPERLTEDPTALSRFEREAKALAVLSHPNVLTILDLTPSSPSLSTRRRGPWPTERQCRITPTSSAGSAHPEAIEEGKRAQELDPLSAETAKTLGATYSWAGRYDEAIRQYNRALEIDLNFALAHDLLADAYARKKMYREAIAEEKKYLSLSGDEEAAGELGRDFTALGYPDAMRALYRKTLALMQEAAKYTYVSPVEFAILHANIGEKDQAFRWLEKAFEERHSRLNFLKADPQFEPLRSDPRFAALIRRVKEVGASVS